MKALIIGDCNSIHIVNFIRVVLEDMDNMEITLFDLKSQEISNKDALEYYEKNNIKVVLNNGLNELVKGSLIRKIPKLRVMAHIKQLNRKIRSLGSFNYCFIHFIDITKSKLVIQNKELYNKIIPVFWGSDLLRNEKLDSASYRQLFKMSHKIVLNTENMKRFFNKAFNTEFDSKVEVIKFPIMSFEKIDQLQETSDTDFLKKEFGLPRDRLLVICGHSGTKQEQYEKMIESLSKCNDEVKEKCYFLFLMTYGPLNLKEYQREIKNLLKDSGLNGAVLSDYMIQEKILKLFICSDIYITTITTDAFSGVMQENLYSGAMMIYGKWLNYFEIENSGIVAQSIDKINKVADSLEEVVRNYEEIQPRLKTNRDLILNISSPKRIKELWANGIL